MNKSWPARLSAGFAVAVLAALSASANAQVSVDGNGNVRYTLPISVPPGINKMAPTLGVVFEGGSSNDILGVGWGFDGVSFVSRCASIPDTDGVVASTAYTPADKLCLDGRRLIQTNASGVPAAFPQTNDSAGQANYIEFRSEIDSFNRIRAYGYAAGSAAASGPAWLRVWSKDGRIYDYGASPSADANSKSVIMATAPGGQPVATTWLLTRMTDAFGNVVDYKYLQRDVAWGSGSSNGSPMAGHEWALSEIQYSGNKVLFNYDDARPDKSENYRLGNKSVRVMRLNSIATYTNAANTGTLGVTASAVAVQTVALTYERGGISGRSRLKSARVCAGGPTSTTCLPATTFTYADGGNQSYAPSTGFAAGSLATLPLYNAAGSRGVLIGDFNGDGRSDILVWDDNPANNALYFSDGQGGFTRATAFASSSASDNLFKSDGCFVSMLSDLNADGLPDIFRFAARSDINGKACPTGGATSVYINNGNGTFTAKPLTLPAGYTSVDRKLSARLIPNDGSKEGWSAGVTFYVIDVDGDGIPDLVSAMRPYQVPTYPAPWPPSTACAMQNCTHVFKGDGTGAFPTDITASSNLLHVDAYTDPDFSYNVASQVHVADADGDGLDDIYTDSGLLRSQGNGNFTILSQVLQCPFPIDFNGDGRLDCFPNYGALSASQGAGSDFAVGNFNLTTQQVTSAGYGRGTLVGDFDGDGREDLLIATDSPGGNTLFLSNGDGSFRQSTSFNLTSSGDALADSAKKTVTLLGDFTGSGSIEMLRLVDTPSSSTGMVNRLYVKSNAAPADQLVSVTTPSGLKTSIGYTYPASIDGRYRSDRGTADAASPALGRCVDIVPARFLVKTVTVDSGVGTATNTREYAWFGDKASLVGRGDLGMRESRFQTLSGDGHTPLTTSSTRLQFFPYIGDSAGSAVYLAGWDNIAGASPITWESLIHCDALSTADPEAAVTAGTNCARGTNKVVQPYTLYTINGGTDVDAARTAMPTKTQRFTMNTSGLVTRAVETRTATVGGASQTYSATTALTPQADVTSCSDNTTCSWQLARAIKSEVTRTVPTAILSTQAGTVANASATQGSGALPGAAMGTVAFGDVTVGASPTMAATLSNTGQAVLSLTVPTASSVSGSGFSFVSTTCGATLAAGASCTTTVKLSPAALTSYIGTLSVNTNVGTKTASLSGTGVAPAVAFQPVSSNWGTVGIASDSGDWPRIVNNSPVSVVLTALAAAGGPGGVYAWQGDSTHCQPGTTVLAPGASCQTFFGTGGLAVPGSYTAVDQLSYQAVGVGGTTFTARQPYSFALAATTSNSSGLSFGNVKPNTTSAAQTFTLKNNATDSPVAITVAMTGSQPANFPMSSNCGPSLGAGASCTVTVSFNPTAMSNGYAAAAQVTTSYPRVQGGAATSYFPISQSFSVPVSGNGAASSLSFSPGSYAFGTQATYGSYSTSVTVTNGGNLATSGLPAGFQATSGISLSGCGSELAVNASCVLAVTWSPTVSGSASGTVVNNAASGGSATSWAWSGTAVTPALRAFTTVTSSGTSTTFTNPNPYPVTPSASGLSVTNNGTATLNTNTCTGAIAAGASCVIAFTAPPAECAALNYNTTAYVTDAAGTAYGTVVKRTSSAKCL